MNRSRMAVLCLALLSVVAIAGCATQPMSMGPSGIGFAPVFTSVTYPADNTAFTRFQFAPSDVVIKGPVSGSSTSHSIIFGLIAIGNSGYEKALAEAREQGADDVVNLRVDASYFNFLGLYSSVTTTITGTAINWKK